MFVFYQKCIRTSAQHVQKVKKAANNKRYAIVVLSNIHALMNIPIHILKHSANFTHYSISEIILRRADSISDVRVGKIAKMEIENRKRIPDKSVISS